MPTGYTEGVCTGRISSFYDYAMGCARAFGALIMMKEEPSGTPIPDRFEPSDYHQKKIAETEKELAEVLALSYEECEKRAIDEYSAAIGSQNNRLEENDRKLARYNAMLSEAKKYTPPTAEHEGFAEFLVKQIEDSIKWDDISDYIEEPVLLSREEWKDEKIKVLHHELDYHRRMHDEEVQMTEGRNEWIRNLKESLEQFKP